MYCSMCIGCNKQATCMVGLAPLSPWGPLQRIRRNAVKLVALLSPICCTYLGPSKAAQLEYMPAML